MDSQDLQSLADAYANSRLPNLKHLDLSENGIVLSDFMHLFDHLCTWNHLLSLNIMNGTHDNEVGYSNEVDRILLYLNSVVTQGGLRSLQKLSINSYETTNILWPKLEKLCLLYCEKDSLGHISNAVDSFLLPTLRTVCIVRYQYYNANITRKLSQSGVSCHQYCAPWDDPFGKYHCQEK